MLFLLTLSLFLTFYLSLSPSLSLLPSLSHSPLSLPPTLSLTPYPPSPPLSSVIPSTLVCNSPQQNSRSQKFCRQHFLNYKGLLRALSIRRQLTNVLTRFGLKIESCNGKSAEASANVVL